MKFFQHSLWLLVFVIALCGSVSAQTTVCSGDTVVLILNGHKQGNTIWKQSPDQTAWSNAQGTSHNDSLVVIATTTLYYSAIVTEGTCSPFYSDTVKIIVNPLASTPTANAASNIAVNSFDANWTVSAGATTYYLDVATDAAFTVFVAGNKNLNVGNVTIYKDTGLTGSTTYYYRVRANNSCGTSANSNTITVTTVTPSYCTLHSTCSGNITDTRDNKIYKTVQIGSQCWMAQNLNVGMKIPGAVQQTNNTIIEKYCYGDVDANCTTYGGLYLWDEMMAYGSSDSVAPGPGGICPAGWHIPVDSEWTCLEKTLGGEITAAKLKDTILWDRSNSSNRIATNSSGFSAYPGGYRDPTQPSSFFVRGYAGYWWTATEVTATDAWSHYLFDDYVQVLRAGITKTLYGFSVRCVKD